MKLEMDVGFGELLIILLAVLILFGPEKLPEVTRTLGKYYRYLMGYKAMLDQEIKRAIYEGGETTSVNRNLVDLSRKNLKAEGGEKETKGAVEGTNKEA